MVYNPQSTHKSHVQEVALPYTNPEQRRLYNREYAKLRRSGSCQTPGQSRLPADFRLQTARDVLDLLADQVQAVLEDAEIKTVERARTIGYLGGLALKAVEVADLSDRVDAMEKALKERKDGGTCNEQDWPAGTTS
jgi:hypothetical protein